MLTTTRAIVLKTIKYGDSQLIADLLTEAHGRLAFILGVPKTRRTRIGRQLLQPLTIVDVVFDYRPNASLQRMKEATLAAPFVSLPFDAAKLSVALFLAECISNTTRAEQCDAPLFRYVEGSVRCLDACTGSCANFHIVFLMHLAAYVGFQPNLDDAAEGAFFDMRNACFCASRPSHDDFLQPDEARKIALLMRMTYETMHLFAFSREERNRCVDIIVAYYRLHMPAFGMLRSLPVLKKLFV